MYNFGTFWQTVITRRIFLKIFPWCHVDSWPSLKFNNRTDIKLYKHIKPLTKLEGISYWNGPYELALTDKNKQVKVGLMIVLECLDMEFWVPQPVFKEVTSMGLNSLGQKRYQISVKSWIFWWSINLINCFRFCYNQCFPLPHPSSDGPGE